MELQSGPHKIMDDINIYSLYRSRWENTPKAFDMAVYMSLSSNYNCSCCFCHAIICLGQKNRIFERNERNTCWEKHSLLKKYKKTNTFQIYEFRKTLLHLYLSNFFYLLLSCNQNRRSNICKIQAELEN